MATMLTLTRELVEKWRVDAVDYVGQLADVKLLVSHYSPVFHSFGIDDKAKVVFIAHVAAATSSTPTELRLSWLQLLRILFRDKECADLDEFATAARFLVGYARLTLADDENSLAFHETLMMEAEKCLSNLVFNSEKARVTFRELAAADILRRIDFVSARLSADGGESPIQRFAELTSLSPLTLWELMFSDMKIAFIISAHMRSVQKDWLDDADATTTFIRVLAKTADDIKRPDSASLTEQVAVQTLNVLYNLYCHAQIFDVDVATLCARECAKIVGGGARYDFDLKQAAVNILALMPTVLSSLCPVAAVNANETTINMTDGDVFEGCNVRFAKDMLAVFEEAMKKLASESNFLTMFIKTMIGLCTECKAARRYCRLKILPPLTAREVQRPPDEGDALRNKIVRLMKGPSEVAHAAAELVYVLCKRSENRMMKYCGFGHAAGIFANRGLLGAAATAQKSALDSEDSETEDYADVEEKVNPITGFIPSIEHVEAIHRQLESMTEEQKEYEAMKLANAMNKLMDESVFKPATVGADGRPRELSHVAELVKDMRLEEEKNSDDEE